MAVNVLPLPGLNFRQLAFHPQKHPGIIHQLSHAGDALISDHQTHVIRREACPGRLEPRRRNT